MEVTVEILLEELQSVEVMLQTAVDMTSNAYKVLTELEVRPDGTLDHDIYQAAATCIPPRYALAFVRRKIHELEQSIEGSKRAG